MSSPISPPKPTIYVARDIERALGLSPRAPLYFIISNSSPLGKKMQEEYSDKILLIDEGRILDTHELLEHETAKKFIQAQEDPHILVFKNTSLIESICKQNSWTLLNPSAELAETIENKITQVEWLGSLTKYLPEHTLQTLEDVSWKNEPFILQFNRAHTGSGTTLVENEAQLQELQKTFPKRPVRITKYIEGPMLTSNNVVAKDEVLPGNISYQITGIEPFTEERFATIGNDWGLPNDILSPEQKTFYREMVKDIGEKMQKQGWLGLFGIDVVLEEKTGKLYLIEINARQPASTTCESSFQEKEDSDLTTMEAHIQALFHESLKGSSIISVNSGSQIVQRVTEKIKEYKKPVFYKDPDFEVIFYTNTKPNSDLIRMKFKGSVMKKHNELSERGSVAMDFSLAMFYGQPWNAPR
ncbi:MAG: ATP-grasp domain-containing protein, partial [Candidatus Magasanikbacteria bacterium]